MNTINFQWRVFPFKFFKNWLDIPLSGTGAIGTRSWSRWFQMYCPVIWRFSCLTFKAHLKTCFSLAASVTTVAEYNLRCSLWFSVQFSKLMGRTKMFPPIDVRLKYASYSLLSHSTFFGWLQLCITQSISALAITYCRGLWLKFVWCSGLSCRVWNSPFHLVTAFLLQLIFWHIFQRCLFVGHWDQLFGWSYPSTVGCGKVERTASRIKATFKRLGFFQDTIFCSVSA